MASLTLWGGLLALLSLCHGQSAAEKLLLGEIQKLTEAIANQKTELLTHFEGMKEELRDDIGAMIVEAKSDWQEMTLTTQNDVATLKHLLDIDECSNLSHNCSSDATCIDTRVSFRCKCKSGFTGDGYTCEDIDECSNKYRCGQYSTCTNIPGKYTCSCLPGFIRTGDVCEDVDECIEGTNRCHKHAICKNTIGSYTCKCTLLHRGNGIICKEVKHATCKEPYEFVHGVGCIHIVKKDQTFGDSRKSCQELEGDLFVANNPEHYLRLAQHFTDTNQAAVNAYMYVGVKEGVWLNGRKVSPKEEAPRNPSMGKNSCSYTDGDTREKFLLWTDPCSNDRWCICEQKF